MIQHLSLKHNFAPGLVILFLSLFSLSCDTQEPLYPAQENVNTLEGKPTQIPGKYIVTLHENTINFRKTNNYEEAQAGMRKISEDLVAKYGVVPQQIDKVYGSLFTGFSATLSPAQLAGLRADPSVQMIEEDGMMYAMNTVTQSNATWGIDRVDQAALPLSTTYTYTNTGSGVNVYIIDTGIRTSHNEFGGRAVRGYDAFGGNSEDCNGHGTHVAGTVGGATYGIAKGVKLFAVRVLDCGGSGTIGGVVAGMDWVAGNKGTPPAVVNMSLGGGASKTMDDAVKRLFDAKIPVIVAAGNSNADAINSSPARALQAYAVGSSTSTDTRSSFSNYGSVVKIFAPGESITSAWYSNNSAAAILSGTSMASPHVAGAAALLLQTNPTSSAQQIYDLISANATKGVVKVNADATITDLLYTKSSTVIDPNPDPITLSATWKKVSNRVVVNLTFTGITSPQVDIYRNTTKLTKTNTGTYEDRTNFKGTGTITYRVCAAGTTNCSSTITVNYQ